MFYTIYKTTNNINGKYYIGKHKTLDLDDTYLGSGKILKHAINKHGINNFTREYLFIFDNEEDMNAKEAELVSEEFIKEDTNYNLAPGGKGGFAYETSIKGNIVAAKKVKHLHATCDIFRKTHKKHIEKAVKVCKEKYPDGIWKGKKHTEETKLKMSKSNTHMKGSNNSNYGNMWIYSLEEKMCKCIKKDEIIPEGWYKGRKMKF